MGRCWLSSPYVCAPHSPHAADAAVPNITRPFSAAASAWAARRVSFDPARRAARLIRVHGSVEPERFADLAGQPPGSQRPRQCNRRRRLKHRFTNPAKVMGIAEDGPLRSGESSHARSGCYTRP
jgi:hypothetical protein